VDYGGVTDGSWWVGLSDRVLESATIAPTPMPRSLRHVLSPVQRSPFVDPPPQVCDDAPKAVHWIGDKVSPFGLFPVDQPDCICNCPLVFGKSSSGAPKWISRPLLFSELLQVFDLASDWAQHIPVPPLGKYASSSVFQGVPSKVLMAFAQILIGSPHHLGESVVESPIIPVSWVRWEVQLWLQLLWTVTHLRR